MADNQAAGSALAGGAIAAALIETLVDKNILTLDEARTVLDRAMRAIGFHIGSQAPGAVEASQLIASMMRGRFTARG